MYLTYISNLYSILKEMQMNLNHGYLKKHKPHQMKVIKTLQTYRLLFIHIDIL